MKRHYENLSLPVIYFDTTRACNLKCKFCMAGSNNPDLVKKSKSEELTATEFEKYILDQAAQLNTRQIQLGGGEFLLRKDAIDIVSRVAKRNIMAAILTNSVEIDEVILRELKRAAGRNLILVFGLNSISNDDINSETRNTNVETVVRAIELCKKNRVRKHVVINIGKFNLDSLDSTFAWLSKHNISFSAFRVGRSCHSQSRRRRRLARPGFPCHQTLRPCGGK